MNATANEATAPTNPALIAGLERRDSRRRSGYDELRRFYDGEQWGAEVLRRSSRNRHLVVNYTRAMIEKSASFLLGGAKAVVTSAAGSTEPTDREDHPALHALREVYEDNGLELLDFDTEVDCSVLGDAAYRVVWDVDRKRVSVSSPDPAGLWVWRVPGSDWDLWRVVQRFDVEPDELGEVHNLSVDWKPSRGLHRLIEVWRAGVYERWVDGRLQESKVNPYGFIPYVVYPNVRAPKRWWGRSDIEAVRESQRELNRALSQLSAILELSGNPITVLEGVDQATDIAARPGAVWTLPKETEAYLLDLLKGGGVDLHIKFVEILYRTLHDLGETPRQAFGESDAALSGVAMELQLDPLVKKIERKRLIRGQAFRRRDQQVLALLAQLGGHAEFAGVRTGREWGALLPADRQREVADHVSLVTAGIEAPSTAASALGSDDGAAEFERVVRELARLPRPGGAAPASRAGIREVS